MKMYSFEEIKNPIFYLHRLLQKMFDRLVGKIKENES